MNVPIAKPSPPVGSGAITVTSATAIGVRRQTGANPWVLAPGVTMHVALFVPLLGDPIGGGPAGHWP
jgi:hypothetical protein